MIERAGTDPAERTLAPVVFSWSANHVFGNQLPALGTTRKVRSFRTQSTRLHTLAYFRLGYHHAAVFTVRLEDFQERARRENRCPPPGLRAIHWFFGHSFRIYFPHIRKEALIPIRGHVTIRTEPVPGYLLQQFAHGIGPKFLAILGVPVSRSRDTSFVTIPHF